MIFTECDYWSVFPFLCIFIFSKRSVMNSVISRKWEFLSKDLSFSWTALWCVKISSTPSRKQPLRSWQDQPQGPLWTFSPECDNEAILFLHRLMATHFLPPPFPVFPPSLTKGHVGSQFLNLELNQWSLL